MSFVEYLRARHAFIVLGVVVTAIALGVTVLLWATIRTHGLVLHGHVTTGDGPRVRVNVDDSDAGGTSARGISLRDIRFGIPLGAMFGAAGYVAILLATILGTSLNKENGLGGFAFTKPVPRERLALTYFAVDAAAIGAMFAYVIVLALFAMTILGVVDRIYVEPGAFSILAIALGCAAMWYGFLQAITSALRFPGQMFIGIGWGTVLILLPLSTVVSLGPAFHAIVMALNYLNPLAYYSSLEITDSSVSTSAVVALSEPLRIATTWSLGILACALAIVNWKRVEV